MKLEQPIKVSEIETKKQDICPHSLTSHSLNAGYTQRVGVNLGEAALFSWGHFPKWESAMSGQQPSLIVGGKISASVLK